MSAALRNLRPLEEGRLLFLSPFAEKRNRFVAALADQVFVAYAEPNGKAERLCREALA